jgi:hypothetical protein
MHSTPQNDVELSSRESQWVDYSDEDKLIDLTIPASWSRQASPGYLLDLHAPGDPWTVLQLSSHSLGTLRFGERVNELILSDSKNWLLQRKASVIQNGVAALEADFGLQSNGAAWLMRKLYLPLNDRLFALGFMTRLATWSRYSEVHRSSFRSFSAFSTRRRSTLATQNSLRSKSTRAIPIDENCLFL